MKISKSEEIKKENRDTTKKTVNNELNYSEGDFMERTINESESQNNKNNSKKENESSNKKLDNIVFNQNIKELNNKIPINSIIKDGENTHNFKWSKHKRDNIKDIKSSTFNLLDQNNVNKMNNDNYIKNLDIMKISVINEMLKI